MVILSMLEDTLIMVTQKFYILFVNDYLLSKGNTTISEYLPEADEVAIQAAKLRYKNRYDEFSRLFPSAMIFGYHFPAAAALAIFAFTTVNHRIDELEREPKSESEKDRALLTSEYISCRNYKNYISWFIYGGALVSSAKVFLTQLK